MLRPLIAPDRSANRSAEHWETAICGESRFVVA